VHWSAAIFELVQAFYISCSDKNFMVISQMVQELYRRPCSDFMDMLRRLISCRIIIIIIALTNKQTDTQTHPQAVHTILLH